MSNSSVLIGRRTSRLNDRRRGREYFPLHVGFAIRERADRCLPERAPMYLQIRSAKSRWRAGEDFYSGLKRKHGAASLGSKDRPWQSRMAVSVAAITFTYRSVSTAHMSAPDCGSSAGLVLRAALRALKKSRASLSSASVTFVWPGATYRTSSSEMAARLFYRA